MQKTTLIGRETVADRTMLFRFAKPEGFTYQAGQTIDLKLVNPTETDEEGNARTFSLASSPDDPHLEIATRMRDTAFKRNLREMPLGTELLFEGPFGSLILHENTKRPAVFLAGGIGITPFRSIIKDAIARGLSHKMMLFYSNRRPEDATFLAELQAWEKSNPNLQLIATMTNMGTSSKKWEGQQSYLTPEMVKRTVPKDVQPIYYVVGPPVMVISVRDGLKGSGISADDIRFEDFAGY